MYKYNDSIPIHFKFRDKYLFRLRSVSDFYFSKGILVKLHYKNFMDAGT